MLYLFSCKLSTSIQFQLLLSSNLAQQTFLGLGLNSDYLGGRGPLGDIHPPPSSLASTDFPFSIDGSRLNSPRSGSIRASVSRKRALSSSPYSDSFDINSMIRFSPNSLATIVNGSRNSSASGSYGHLSAGAMSPALGMHSASGMAPHIQQLQAHLLRAGAGLLHPLPPHHNPSSASMFSLAHHPLQTSNPLPKPPVSITLGLPAVNSSGGKGLKVSLLLSTWKSSNDRNRNYPHPALKWSRLRQTALRTLWHAGVVASGTRLVIMGPI